MNSGDVPKGLRLDYQLDTVVAVVTVSGDIDVATCGMACCGWSPMRAIAAWR
jgi:hypothetical protein